MKRDLKNLLTLSKLKTASRRKLKNAKQGSGKFLDPLELDFSTFSVSLEWSSRIWMRRNVNDVYELEGVFEKQCDYSASLE